MSVEVFAALGIIVLSFLVFLLILGPKFKFLWAYWSNKINPPSYLSSSSSQPFSEYSNTTEQSQSVQTGTTGAAEAIPSSDTLIEPPLKIHSYPKKKLSRHLKLKRESSLETLSSNLSETSTVIEDSAIVVIIPDREPPPTYQPSGSQNSSSY